MAMATVARFLSLAPLVLTSQLPIAVADGAGVLASRKQHQQNTFQSSCSALASQVGDEIPDSRVNLAEFVQAGTNLSLPDNDPTCTPSSQVVNVDICRVKLEVQTSNSSGITLEAWLPQNYTGRFLSTGNGGLGGCK